MHRLINKTSKGLETDHINGNKVDNRKCNLRTVTRSENELNKGVRSDNSSGFQGVCWDKSRNKWVVRLAKIHIGRFDKLEQAIWARKIAMRVYNGLQWFR